MALELHKYFRNLKLDGSGIYKTQHSTTVSYPSDGNESAGHVEDTSFWFRHRLNCLVTLIKKFPPQGPLIDVGGGNGFVTYGLQSCGFEVLLLEPGPKGVIQALGRGVTNVVEGSLNQTDIVDESVPAFSFFDVIEHISDDKDFMTLAFQKLAPGGFVYITVPAFTFLWSSDDDYAGHFRRYSLGKIVELLRRDGFRIEYSTYIFSILIAPLFCLKSIPYIFGLKSKTRTLSLLQKDHLAKDTLLKRLILKILSIEDKVLQKGFKIPFGTSCVVIASKPRVKQNDI